jgi:hypothetical protein
MQERSSASADKAQIAARAAVSARNFEGFIEEKDRPSLPFGARGADSVSVADDERELTGMQRTKSLWMAPFCRGEIIATMIAATTRLAGRRKGALGVSVV